MDNDSSNVQVPSSQWPSSDSPFRPAKRRKLDFVRSPSPASDTSPEDYDLPDYDPEQAEEQRKKSKYEDVLHNPQFVDEPKDTFVTQLTQQSSSPSRIRGPRWKKKGRTPSQPPLSPTHKVQPRGQRSSDTQQPAKTQVKVPYQRTASGNSTVLIQDGDDEFELDPELEEALIAADNDPGVESVQVSFNSLNSQNQCAQQSTSFRQTTLHGMSTTQTQLPSTQRRTHNWPLATRNEPPTHHKTDKEAMQTWVYPKNLGRKRDYQFNIVHKGLYHNLLVALPTGLGKTFIAATVMLNWYRWTKDAQIIFVAPTKPLVSQQIDACFNIAGILRSQTTMLTGEVSTGVRAEDWQEKRVFFMTPQTLINDLKTGICDPKRIVLLVVDEAHRATGNYAYVEVVRFIRRFNSSFRVLALTATPGATVEAVQKVIDGLDISRVEIRSDESLDIRSFVYTKDTELEVFDYNDEMNMTLDLFAKCTGPLVSKLYAQAAYWSKDPLKLHPFGLHQAHNKWNKSDAGRHANQGVKGMMRSIFALLSPLAFNLELLKFHGIGPFYHKMKAFEDEAGSGKYAREMKDNEHFRKLMNRLRGWINNPDFVGHPKLSYLKEVVLNHFMDAGEGRGASGRPPSDTRIMIFTTYRDSAEEINRVLSKHEPMIRPHVFVGQSASRDSAGMDQKMQQDIVDKFKKGTYNTLVATSIGEEGLDIGEVDLIVCYDCSKSPIRMLQRMGRTGRKRQGKIALLLMRDKEEQAYYTAKDNHVKMQKLIESGKDFNFHEDRSMRIVPKEINPIVDECIVEIPIENTQTEAMDPKKRRPKNSNAKKPKKKFHMPDNVETGFTFLGKSKKTNKQSTTVQSQYLLDLELADLPSLQDVILTEKQEVELDQRYAQVAGTEPQYVQQVRFNARPESYRTLGRTAQVKHSGATERVLTAFRAMHKEFMDWERPDVPDQDLERDDASGVESEEESSPRDRGNSTGKQATRRAPPPMPFSDDMDEYDLSDGFVVRDEDTENDTKSSDTEDLTLQKPTAKAEPTCEPFYVSQKSMHELSDEELPAMDFLVQGKGKAAVRRPLRIVASDDDE